MDYQEPREQRAIPESAAVSHGVLPAEQGHDTQTFDPAAFRWGGTAGIRQRGGGTLTKGSLLPAARVGDGEAFDGFGVYAGGLHPVELRVEAFRVHGDFAPGDVPRIYPAVEDLLECPLSS